MHRLIFGPKLAYQVLFNKSPETLHQDCIQMACVEPVIEDKYMAVTTANPEIYRQYERRNIIMESVELKGAKERIDQEQRIEMKRITQERAALSKEWRKLLIDGAIVQRSDVTLDFPTLRQRRKSIEFEDITLPSKVSASSNLTAFVKFGRFKSPVVSSRVIKRAMSDQRLNTLQDLKTYQHWEGDPAAINSVRRELRPRAVQMEHTNFIRSRKFDTRNQPIKSTLPAVFSRQSSFNQMIKHGSGGLRPLSADIVPAALSDKPPIPGIANKEPSKLSLQNSPANRSAKPKRTQNKIFDDQPATHVGKHPETQSTKESRQNFMPDSQLTKNKRNSAKGSKQVSPTSSASKEADTSSEKSVKPTKQTAKKKTSFGNNKIQPQ